MSPEEIRSRLRTGEDGRTAFKSVQGKGPQKEDLAKELVAFANSGGGSLLLGVEDDATLTGTGTAKDAETWQRFLAQVAREAIRPSLRVSLRTVEVDSKLVVVVDVPGHQPGRPFQGRSKYFLRDGPESREASPEELKRILHSAPSSYFDEHPVPDATADDLDENAVKALVDAIAKTSGRRAPMSALRAMKLVDTEGKPTVAGILLCGKDPQRFFRLS